MASSSQTLNVYQKVYHSIPSKKLVNFTWLEKIHHKHGTQIGPDFINVGMGGGPQIVMYPL